MPTYEFDPTRAWLRDPDLFQRFTPTGDGTPLASARLAKNDELFIIERGGQRRGFLLREMSFPHGAQGLLAGEPYLVSY